MNNLIEWFAKNGVVANLLAFFIVTLGFMSIGTLKQEVFPEFSSNMIFITVPYPGAAPDEVEEGVCQRIEEAVYGLTDVEKVTSTSIENAGTIVVELTPGADVSHALDEIKAQVDAIDTFPEESEKPVIREIIQTVKRTIAGLQAEGVADGSVRPGHPVLTALSVISQPVYLTLVAPMLRSVGGIDLSDPATRRLAVEHTLAFVDAALTPRAG